MTTITIIKKIKQKIDSIAEFIYSGFVIFAEYNNVRNNLSHLNPEYNPSTSELSRKKGKFSLNLINTNKKLNSRGEGAKNGS